MKRAVEQLPVTADFLLVDALPLTCRWPSSPYRRRCACHSIAAASILAKVHAMRRMREWDVVFPQYGLARHKGYYTPEHVAAIEEHGPTWLHRYTFAPIAQPTLTFAAVAAGEGLTE